MIMIMIIVIICFYTIIMLQRWRYTNESAMSVLLSITPQLDDLPFIEVSSEGSLKVLGVQDVDAGDYECVAVNEAGTSSAVVNLDIGCTFTVPRNSSLGLLSSLGHIVDEDVQLGVLFFYTYNAYYRIR